MPLKYHADTVALLATIPGISADAVEAIERMESEVGFTFPASLREWYSLEGACDILLEHSNSDPPVAVQDMLAPRTDTNGGGPHDLLAEGLVPIRYENQAVAVWAVRLTGDDDPPVVVDYDTQFREWRPCADTFSRYVYACVWDHRMVHSKSAFACTDNVPFDDSQFAFLRANFREAPSTSGWPRDVSHRFYSTSQALLVWADEVADWFLGADSEAALEELIHKIGHLASLKNYLYSHTDSGNRVLGRVREGS